MRLARLFAFVAAGAVAAPVAAQQADVDALKAEAARMRQSLDELDAKIRAREGEKPVAPAAAAPAPKPDNEQPVGSYVSLQQSWSQVQTGLPKERVDALLGKPERVMQINGDDVWYYVYPGLGRGSVFFNTKGIVTASQPPRIGWGW